VFFGVLWCSFVFQVSNFGPFWVYFKISKIIKEFWTLILHIPIVLWRSTLFFCVLWCSWSCYSTNFKIYSNPQSHTGLFISHRFGHDSSLVFFGVLWGSFVFFCVLEPHFQGNIDCSYSHIGTGGILQCSFAFQEVLFCSIVFQNLFFKTPPLPKVLKVITELPKVL